MQIKELRSREEIEQFVRELVPGDIIRTDFVGFSLVDKVTETELVIVKPDIASEIRVTRGRKEKIKVIKPNQYAPEYSLVLVPIISQMLEPGKGEYQRYSGLIEQAKQAGAGF